MVAVAQAGVSRGHTLAQGPGRILATHTHTHAYTTMASAAAVRTRTPAYVPVLFVALAALTAQCTRARSELNAYKETTDAKIEVLSARLEEYKSCLLPHGPLSISERYTWCD